MVELMQQSRGTATGDEAMMMAHLYMKAISCSAPCASVYMDGQAHGDVQGGHVVLEHRPDLLARAEPRICAFDIETTKLPLQFPNAEYDQVG